MTIEQHELGSILCTHGNTHICERGVCDKNKYILWDKVDSLFLDLSQLTLTSSPIGDSMEVRVVSTTESVIYLTHRDLFGIRRKAKASLWDSYQLIVSKVIDRQLTKLTTDIAEGKTFTFDHFHITSSAIYKKKFFRGYVTIDLSRVTNCFFHSGDFYVFFIDDRRREMAQYLGPVRGIPNIHLAQAFLKSVAQRNSRP